MFLVIINIKKICIFSVGIGELNDLELLHKSDRLTKKCTGCPKTRELEDELKIVFDYQ